MKKLMSLLALALLMVGSAMAHTSAGMLRSADIAAGYTKAPARQMKAKVPSRKATVPPKGNLVYYDKTAVGTFVLNGQMGLYEDIFPAEVIWGENGKVYFKNFISVLPDDYYVEGTLQGNIVTIPTDQTIEYFEEEGYGLNFGVLKTVPTTIDGEDVYIFQYVPEIKSIQIEVESDGTMSLILPGKPFDGENIPEYVVGVYYSDDHEFTGYSDFAQSYRKLDLQLVTMPEEAKIEKYVYIDEWSYASIVDVAFYGGYLYIRGLNSMLPEGTIRARIEGDKAYVRQNEFLGTYFDLYYIYSKVLYDNPDYDEDDQESQPFIVAPENVEFQLNISPDRHSIYADKDGVYLSFHCNENDFLSSLGYYGIFEINYQASFAGVPSNPIDLEFHTEWASRQGWNDFFFTITNFSTEGSYLDADKLYYKVFVNGEPLVFEQMDVIDLMGYPAVAYMGVPIPVELMPYFFNNNEDIFKFSDSAFDVGIYTDDVETIGVQSFYYFEEKFTYSDIVTLNVATGEVTTESGVDPVVADSPKVSVTYFTLDGRRVANPDHGLYIEVTRRADGSVSSRKIMR